MCNKMCIDLSVAPHIPPSSGAPPRTLAPGRILFPTGSSGNHDIRSFLPSCNSTPHLVSVAQSVTAAIALHKADKATTEVARVARRKALKEKFEEAAHRNLVPLGKGVTWSPEGLNSVPVLDEGRGVTWSPASGDPGPEVDADTEDVLALPPLPTRKRGSTFRRMTKVDRLTRQLEVQEQISAAAGSLAASLQGAAHMDLSPLNETTPPLVWNDPVVSPPTLR
jgi:hypothetical protein